MDGPLEASSSSSVLASPRPSSSAAPSHRLLYRGALSLPDSLLLLDGLSFTLPLDAPGSAGPGMEELMNNPLALTLESMRGRPSLHLVGVEDVEAVWVDPASVCVDIHPLCTLTRTYLDTVLCLEPITSPSGRTHSGVRVSLSDNNDPGSDILIYGRLPSSSTSTSKASSSPITLPLFASRIFPTPPPARPDDPTPRRPPPAFHLSSLLSLSTATEADTNKRKREPSSSAYLSKRPKPIGKGNSRADHDPDAVEEPDEEAKAAEIRNAREVMKNIPKPGMFRTLGKDARARPPDAGGSMFKVPDVPQRVVADGKGKGKAHEEEDNGMKSVMDELEKANKLIIKKSTIRAFGPYSISKRTHPEYNDMYSLIVKSVAFALRNEIRKKALDSRLVDHLVDRQLEIYVDPPLPP